jgi:hypothetical protein
MKIIDKIRAWRDVQYTSPDEAKRLQDESVAAVIGGIESDAWKKFMKNFHSNTQQLQRLCGEDDFRTSHDYGETILAYVASGGECGGGTRFALVLEDMPGSWRVDLDRDLSSDTAPDSGPNMLPPEHEQFVRENPS